MRFSDKKEAANPDYLLCLPGSSLLPTFLVRFLEVPGPYSVFKAAWNAQPLGDGMLHAG